MYGNDKNPGGAAGPATRRPAAAALALLVCLATALSVLAALTALAPGADAAARPRAVPDRYTVKEDEILRVQRPGVLRNDQPRRLGKDARLVRGVRHGFLTLDFDGSMEYDTKRNYNGKDTFRYKACQAPGVANCSLPTTVTLNVIPVNDPPVANDDGYRTAEDRALTVTAENGLLRNDTDVDRNDALSVAEPKPRTAPLHGKVTVNGDGSYTYTPDADFNGQDSFTYAATDGKTEESATVRITIGAVQDAPDARNDVFYFRNGIFHQTKAPGPLENDQDPDAGPGQPDGENVRVVAYTRPNKANPYILYPKGARSFKFPEGFTGKQVHTYTISDSDGNKDTARVTYYVRD